MDSEARHPNTHGRLRVVDLRIGSERRQLHFGGGFACVIADPDARSEAARWIATTIVGPPATGSGSNRPTESADEEPSWRLQAPLLPLRVPAVVDRDLLQTLWRSDCVRRLEELATSRESLDSERVRLGAELDRLRIQPPLTTRASGPAPLPEEAESEIAAFRDSARRFVRVQSLLATINSLRPGPSREALELADAWDARESEIEASPPADTAPAAPAAPAAPNAAEEARRAELERLHRAVVKAESRIFGRRVINRKRALEKYNAAAGAERAALAGAGVDSYAEFLLESNAPAPTERDAAPNERDAAREAASRARIEERITELRARARALLGREPGFDVAGELRAHLVESPARAAHVEELAALLRAEGFSDADDVMAQARAFLAKPPSVHVPQPPTWAMLVAGSEVPLAEIERIEQELAAKDELVASQEVEAAHLVATRDADLLRLGPDDFVRVVAALFAAYRAGEVLEGHLPLVLDGVLDGLAADARDAAVFALAAVDDAQVIVVTDDEVVARRMSDAGGTIVRWPAPEEQRNRGISG